MAFELRSPAFLEGDEIPPRYTCEGADASPPLTWSGVPKGTRSLALIVEDPDAPDPAAPQRTFVHWVVYDIPAGSSSLPDDASREGLPAAAREGVNDYLNASWNGPCPPKGRHRYFFRMFALDSRVGLKGNLPAEDLRAAIEGHVLGRAELMGTYEKRVPRAREAEPRADV